MAEIWVSCLTAPLKVDVLKGGFLKGATEKWTDGRRQVFGVSVNLVVVFCLVLREMLPIPTSWQIADTARNVVDESSLISNAGLLPQVKLDSGVRVEACVLVRVPPRIGMEWSMGFCVDS